MEENNEKESSKILRQNKLPGSEKLTRPEEIGYLSKFLKKIREVQDENTELPDWELGLYGRNSGALPDIKTLESKVIGVSKNENLSDITLQSTTIGMEEGINPEINLVNSLDKLDIEDNITLDKNREVLDTKDNVELSDKRHKIYVDDVKNLEKSESKLPGKNIEVNLDDHLESIYNNAELNLSNSKVNLNVSDESTLDNSVINLKATDVKNLSDHLEKISTSDINSLSNYIDNLESEEIDSLEDYRDNIEIENIDSLEDYRDNLKIENIDSLEDYRDNIEIENIDSLENYRDNLKIENIDSLEDYRDNIKTEEIDSLENYLDSLKTEEIDSLEDYLEKRSPNSFYKKQNSGNYHDGSSHSGDNYGSNFIFEENKVYNSKVIKRDSANTDGSKNFKQDPNKSNWAQKLKEPLVNKPENLNVEKDDLEDYLEPTKDNEDLNRRKEELYEILESNSPEDLKLFNLVGWYIRNNATLDGFTMPDSDPDHQEEGQYVRSTKEWYKKLGALVSSYLSGEASIDGILAVEDFLSKEFITHLPDRNVGDLKLGPRQATVVSLFDDIGYLLSQDKSSKEVKGHKDYSNVIKKQDYKNVPNYRADISKGTGLNTIEKIDNGINTVTGTQYLRKLAEDLIDKSGLKGKAKTKELTKILISLVFLQRKTEAFLGKTRDRLPGPVGNLLTNIWSQVGNINSIIKKEKSKYESGVKLDLNTYENIKGSIKTGTGLVNDLFGAKNTTSVKNRPQKGDQTADSLKNLLKGDSAITGFTSDKVKTTGFEQANNREIPWVEKEELLLYETMNNGYAVDIPGGTYDPKDETFKDAYKGGRVDFKKAYLNSEGILTTLFDLCGGEKLFDSSKPSWGVPSTYEELKETLMKSEHITTVGSFGSSTKGLHHRTMTLSDNSYWEIRIEPFCNKYMNGGWSYLPAFQEINLVNQRLHGVHTMYNEWVPVISFDYEKAKLNTKTASLFEGEIVYPVSAEMLNDLRLTVVDDQFKSWSSYFRKCMEVSVYNSVPHNINYYYNIYKKDTENFADESAIVPTFIDHSHHATALYKNVTFRIRIYIMTPQYSTIKKFDLLCVLKDFQELYTGSIDAGGATDIDLQFSVVGENPDEYVYMMETDKYSEYTVLQEVSKENTKKEFDKAKADKIIYEDTIPEEEEGEVDLNDEYSVEATRLRIRQYQKENNIETYKEAQQKYFGLDKDKNKGNEEKPAATTKEGAVTPKTEENKTSAPTTSSN